MEMRKPTVFLFIIVLLISACSSVLVAGCGGGDDTSVEEKTATEETSPSTAPTEEEKTFTLEDLGEFDGKDGQPAYVAVDGVVYDVSNSSDWPEGKHTPCSLDASAGKDLSEVLEHSPPSMRSYIEAKPVVGVLQAS